MNDTLTETAIDSTPTAGGNLPMTPESTPTTSAGVPAPQDIVLTVDGQETSPADALSGSGVPAGLKAPEIPSPTGRECPAPLPVDWQVRLGKLLAADGNENPQAKPMIGEHNVKVEGVLNVVTDEGKVMTIEVNTILPGALSPASIGLLAQAQFEGILDLLVTKPAMAGFITYLQKLQA